MLPILSLEILTQISLASNAINKFERKIAGKGAVRAQKVFNLFISDEDVINIIEIIESLEDSDVLIDGITETVKSEIRAEGGYIRRAARGYIDKRFQF